MALNDPVTTTSDLLIPHRLLNTIMVADFKYYDYIRLTTFFQDNLGKLAPER